MEYVVYTCKLGHVVLRADDPNPNPVALEYAKQGPAWDGSPAHTHFAKGKFYLSPGGWLLYGPGELPVDLEYREVTRAA